MAKPDFTAALLRELLDYNPETGYFIWRPRPMALFEGPRAGPIWHTRYCGKRAGSLSKALGYETIRVFDRAYWSHRLAWLHVTGEHPVGEIDHINGDRSDNRISNLRDVSRQINQQNMRKTISSRTMPLGVFLNERKVVRRYSASIQIDGHAKHLGYFDTPEIAHAAYVQAKRLHHPGCTI